MELISYLGRQVHVTLINNFYYVGKVILADQESITLIDLKNKRVSLTKNSILTIRELEQ